MAASHDRAALQSYLELCKQLGTVPCQPFLQCLQERHRTCKLARFDQEEQLHATMSLLPYAELQELDFSGLKLPLCGWITVLDSCSKCQGLRVLSLKGCSLGSLGEGTQERLATLTGACQVVVLDVSGNFLDDSFLLPFSQTSLIGGGDSLTVLDLSENDFTDGGVAVLAGSMELDGLKCQLKQLDISFNKLGDRAACSLASLLSSVPLLALELEGNQISDAGAVALAASLKDAVCLQRLNINHNKFSSQALSAIADALRLSTSALHELAIAGVSGTEDGVAAVLQAACSNKCLQLLDIRGMPVRQQAVHSVCQLLSSPAPLVTLRLDVATKEAAELIAQALPNNSSLLHLMMGGPVPEHVLSFIAASLSSNTLSKLQQQGSVSAACSPGAKNTQTAQQLSPGRPASAGRSPPGSSGRAKAPMGTGRSTGSPGRPAGAGLLGSRGAARPVLVRSTTQQARNLSTLDPSGLAGLAGGGAANKAAEVFRRHDTDSSGFLDAEAMMAALQDLGMLEGMKARQLGKFLSNTIREADVDQDGRVNLEDFTKYYERLARHYAEAARQGRISFRCKAPAMPVDAASNEHLKKVFRAYCKLRVGQGRQVGASIQHINAAQFHQMCRDAGLLDPTGPLSQCAVDIVFTRCKPPGSRRLSFKEFLEAVATVAEEAGFTFEAITEALTITSSTSPPPSPLPDQIEGEYYGGAGLMATAAARGSLGSAHAKPHISDILDNRVGPQLPSRASYASRGSALSSGSETTAHTSTQRPYQQGHIPPAGASTCAPTVVSVSHSLSGSHTAASANCAGPRLTAIAAAGQQQQLSGQGVQNPLYEAVEEDRQTQTRQLEARLSALEDKLATQAERNTAADVYNAEDSIAAGHCTDDLLPRLHCAEASIAQQEQQLAAVIGQQEAFKEVVTRLVESLQCQTQAANNAASAEVEELQYQVKALSSEVGQLRVLKATLEEHTVEDRLQELSRRVEDRQTRAETAIYQVARQVDVLDAKLRDEIDSSMSALQAILSSAAPGR